MIKLIKASALSEVVKKLQDIVAQNEQNQKETIIFCEDRLTLAVERAICDRLGGTFLTSVYTLSRFLSTERGKKSNVLSSQGSAMAIRRIIEENRGKLKLFGRFAAAPAASAVYDTIAMLYASKISAEQLEKAAIKGLLGSKLYDIAFIYSKYGEYLAANDKIDRNAYLCELPFVIENSDKIKGKDVIFLGFQSFTRASSDCVRAALSVAANGYGLFVEGDGELYVKEGARVFEEIASKLGGAKPERASGDLLSEVKHLQSSLFNPEIYRYSSAMKTDRIRLWEAADEDEEIEFIAASIKKYVVEGKGAGARFLDVCVMLPDVASAERRIARLFSKFNIPYYADRRHALIEHPVCEFILSYLACVNSGCVLSDVDAVVCSPFFPEKSDDKDAYRNYAIRLADFRGGVARPPKKEILDKMKFDYDGVQRVRSTFLRGFSLLPKGDKVAPAEAANAIRLLLKDFKVEEKLQSVKEEFRNEYPAISEFSGRAYDAVLAVIEEAESVLGRGYMPINEYAKILKSGFTAMEISLIPTKLDAVLIGDVAATASVGSDVLFVAGLGENVPQTGADTSLLTDSDVDCLLRANIDISPKISQVNTRRREQTALNICAFKKRLYLSYSVRRGGEEGGASEIFDYVKNAFDLGLSENKIPKISTEKLKLLPYYCLDKLSALNALCVADASQAATIKRALKENGIAANEGAGHIKENLRRGKELFASFDCVSPTTLEAYYSCPYRSFMQQGLKLQEREEGAMRALDTGNFIHAVLQAVALKMGNCKDESEVKQLAEAEADKLINQDAYSALKATKRGEYTADKLKDEACKVAAGAFEQLNNSKFNVEKTEERCEIKLDCGIKIGGRIDRIDGYGDMIRIIDYKTGAIDASAKKYYMGLKLQLPLYLTAAAENRRAVGAYYFPATVEYKAEDDGVFRLQGFMDGGDDVVSAGEKELAPKTKSKYFNAYLAGRKVDGTMDKDTFAAFLEYSKIMAQQGAQEMIDGNISPSPAEEACTYCKMGGSCNFSAGINGEERSSTAVKCEDIAQIVKAKTEGEK